MNQTVCLLVGVFLIAVGCAYMWSCNKTNVEEPVEKEEEFPMSNGWRYKPLDSLDDASAHAYVLVTKDGQAGEIQVPHPYVEK